MKNILFKTILFVIIVLSLAWSKSSEDIISPGSQPQLGMDSKGVVRVVFGRADSIFCATSKDEGLTFSKPLFVAHISDMHLGMTRGPQIASSDRYSVITAIDKSGNIHFFQLMHPQGKWEYKGLVNDIKSSAPEGLMSIAADKQDNFYAVWLDIRQDKKNNICFSALSGKAGKWRKNALVYISPDEHVCECCKPGIAVKNGKVAIMFRNWLQGSRDLYLIASSNGGKTFDKAQKLGNGTWKLNGCPMDGGGITIDKDGGVHTIWQRDGNVYYCKPNENEVQLGKGRTCGVAVDNSNNKKVVVTMQDGGNVKIIDLNKKELIAGKGGFLKSILLPDEKVLCVWEQDKNIKFRQLEMPSANNLTSSGLQGQ